VSNKCLSVGERARQGKRDEGVGKGLGSARQLGQRSGEGARQSKPNGPRQRSGTRGPGSARQLGQKSGEGARQSRPKGLRRGHSAVTVSPSGPPGLFKGVTTATSGVIARFPLLLHTYVQNSSRAPKGQCHGVLIVYFEGHGHRAEFHTVQTRN